MGNKVSTGFFYEIEEELGVLETSGKTETKVCMISYNGAEAKYDIRKWDMKGEEPKMLKGTTLSVEAARELARIIVKREGIGVIADLVVMEE